ncbi:MAG TPA: Gldg family protein [Anaerolineales bacterium]|nr:Gldg family protein [Anaerolineales bacterium]
MDNKTRIYAPLGLGLAGAAALGAAGVYLVLREFNLTVQILLGLVVVGLALFVILDPDRTRRAFTGRQARYGSNALVLSIAFIGLLVVANLLAAQNPQRWDLTEDKTYTLTDETIAALEQLPAPVKATAFFTQSLDSSSASGLLEQYAYYGKDNFTFSFVDPDADPIAAQTAGISRDGTVVLAMGDPSMGAQTLQVTTISEQELTSGLVRLMNPQASVVYFLTGHGELSPEDTGDRSFSQVKRLLVSKNYAVNTLSLLGTNAIPEDATAIVIAGPTTALTQAEVDLISAFQANGGGLVVLYEPPVDEASSLGPDDPLAAYLQSQWGVKFDANVVLDPTSQQPQAPYAASYGQHAITAQMNNVSAWFPTARSVTLSEVAGGASQTPLVFSSQQAWGEADIPGLVGWFQTGEGQVQYDEGADVLGPVTLAAAAENTSTQARLVVYGDSDFPSNANFLAFGNGDLFVNSVDWSAGLEELISLNPRTATTRTVASPQAYTLNLIFLGTVILVPGVALVAGILTFIQRRRRG